MSSSTSSTESAQPEILPSEVAAPEAIATPVGRLLFALFVAVAIFLISLAARRIHPSSLFDFPLALDLLILLAPSITGFVMVCVMSKTITEWDDGSRASHIRAMAACCVVGILVFLACLWLGGYRGAIKHLLVVICLYVMFSIWDILVCIWTSKVEIKSSVATGHRQINRPSILVFGILILVMWWFPDAFGTSGSVTLAQENSGEVSRENAIQDIGVTPATVDYFVAGTIAFHLLITALVYFADVIPRRKPLSGVQRIPYCILRWLPNCEDDGAR